jgi:hypothetical protein
MKSSLIRSSLAANGINKNTVNRYGLDDICLYELLTRLLLPYNEWPAYNEKVIDENGNILIPRNRLNIKQKNSFTKFDSLVIKIRKQLDKTAYGNMTKNMPPQVALSLLLRESEVPVNVTGPAIQNKDIPLSFLRRKINKKQKDTENGRTIKNS